MSKRANDDSMSFLDHIEELRWHLIRSVIVILVFAIVAFIFRSFIFDSVILAPKKADFVTNRLLCEFGHSVGTEALCINQKSFQIINIKLSGQLMTHITVSFIVGFLVAFPWIFFEFWRFIKPALNRREIKHSRGTVFFTSILFTTGALFGYYIITPLSVYFLGTYTVSADVTNQITLSSYIQTITSVTLASGVVFELPIFILFLSKIGLVTPQFLKKYRKHAIVVILTLSAIITPPDIFSQVLVALPLGVLYEVGIIISRKVHKKKEAAESKDIVLT